MGRTRYYTATLSHDIPRPVHSNWQLQTSVADVLRRATALQPLTPPQMRVENGTVFLGGTVGTAMRKWVAENLIRLTPGVSQVVNNIEVSEPLPRPKTSATLR